MTPEEFKKQYLPLHRRLYALALKSLGDSNEAQDAVQTLYLKLWERQRQLDDIENRWSFCAKILLNICADRWREINKQATEELNEELPDINTTDYAFTDFENFTKDYIDNLPQKQKLVIKMRMQGASTEEIEKLTGLSPTNIRTILSRVRKELRKIYNT